MNTATRVLSLSLVLLISAPAVSAAQDPVDPLALVQDGRKLNAAGKFDEALAAFEKALKIDPQLFDAHLATGITYDLKGDYTRARASLKRAIETAPDGSKGQAIGAMAVSFAFEKNAADAATYYQQQLEAQTRAGAIDAAAATANAMARVYLESGDPQTALKWYETGYATSKKLTSPPPDQVDLWELRWLHARSRIAARLGDAAGADKYAAGVKAIVDKGGLNEEQRPAYQYLVGYNAFYAGKYETAIAELLKADQRDPFILGLLAQAYEQSNDIVRAREYYTRVLASTSHNLQNAFSRPLARKKLAELK